MINKQAVAKNWKVLSAVIFLTSVIVVGSGYFQGVIAQTDTSTASQQTSPGNDGTVGTSQNPSAQIAGGDAALRQSFSFSHSTFVQAGVGLRNVGSGTISVHIPTGAVLTKALLYWTFLDSGTATAPATSNLATAYFNGEKITGSRIATGASPCWSDPNIYVYRADVTSTLVRRGGPISDQYVSVTSAIVNATSPWPSFAPIQQAESAHLIVVYKDPSEPTSSTTRIFDATGSPGTITFSGTTTFTAPFAAAHVGGDIARVGYALADGQSVGNPQPNSKSFAWTSSPSAATTTLNAGEMYGKDPSITSKAAFQGSLSDTEEYDVTSNTSGGDTSGVLTWNFGVDCLTTVYAAVTG